MRRAARNCPATSVVVGDDHQRGALGFPGALAGDERFERIRVPLGGRRTVAGVLGVPDLVGHRRERDFDTCPGDRIELAEQLVHAVGLPLDVRLALRALAAPPLLEVLAGGTLVHVIAHRVAEHIGGFLLSGGQQHRLVDRRVRRRIGDRPSVLRRDRTVGQRLSSTRQVGEPPRELHLPLGATPGLLQVTPQHLRRARLTVTVRQRGDRLGPHTRQAGLAAPHQPQTLLEPLTAQRAQPRHQRIQQPQQIHRGGLAGARRTGGGKRGGRRRLSRTWPTPGGRRTGGRGGRRRGRISPTWSAPRRRLSAGHRTATGSARWRRCLSPIRPMLRGGSTGRTSTGHNSRRRRVREEVQVGHRWLPRGTRRHRVRVGGADEPVGEPRPPQQQGSVTGTRTLHNPGDTHNTCSCYHGKIFAILEDCRPHRQHADLEA